MTRRRRGRLPRLLFDYVDGGAGAGRTGGNDGPPRGGTGEALGRCRGHPVLPFDRRHLHDGGSGPRLEQAVIDYLLHPGWLWDVALNGRPHVFGNIAQYVPKATTPADFAAWVGSQFDASVDWKDIEWLRGQWRGHLVLKGILDPADARSAIAAGADGLIVSNHGGRQLDGVASSAYMLSRVADAVGGETTLLVDGGIRCGQDLVKALALGAKAALIGRPWVYALAAAGEAGLTRMLTMFRTDMTTALGLAGVPQASRVRRDVLLVDSG